MSNATEAEAGVTPEDLARLRRLARLYYLLFGVLALCASYPLRYTFLGLCLLYAPDWVDHAADMDSRLGVVLIILSLVVTGIGWTCILPILLAGRGLARQQRYGLCRMVALVLYLLIPFGTMLAIQTNRILAEPAVKRRFLEGPPEPAATDEQASRRRFGPKRAQNLPIVRHSLPVGIYAAAAASLDETACEMGLCVATAAAVVAWPASCIPPWAAAPLECGDLSPLWHCR